MKRVATTNPKFDFHKCNLLRFKRLFLLFIQINLMITGAMRKEFKSTQNFFKTSQEGSHKAHLCCLNNHYFQQYQPIDFRFYT